MAQIQVKIEHLFIFLAEIGSKSSFTPVIPAHRLRFPLELLFDALHAVLIILNF